MSRLTSQSRSRFRPLHVPRPLRDQVLSTVEEHAKRFADDLDYAVLNFRLYRSRDAMLELTRHRWQEQSLDALLSLPSGVHAAADAFFHELDRVRVWAELVDDMPETLRARLERANTRIQSAAMALRMACAATRNPPAVSQADTPSDGRRS